MVFTIKEGQSLLSQSGETVKCRIFFIPGSEIGAHAVRITGAVVVRITVVVDIGEVGSGY